METNEEYDLEIELSDDQLVAAVEYYLNNVLLKTPCNIVAGGYDFYSDRGMIVTIKFQE